MKKIILSGVLTLCATALMTQASPANAAHPAGLAGWWKLDGDTMDSSSNALHGISTPADADTYVDHDVLGQALDLDGTYNVSVPDNDALEPADRLTVEAWVKRDGTPGTYKHIVAKGAISCSSSSYALYTGNTGGLRFYITVLGGYKLSPAVAVAEVWDDEWHHVAGVYNGSTVRLFLDGNEIGTGTSASGDIIYTDQDLTFGRYANQCGGHNYFQYTGYLDDVRIWSTARDQMDLGYYDYDLDGISDENGNDLCPATTAEEPDVKLGTNRWIWNGDSWETNLPKGKGPKFTSTMDFTYGCSCEQILDEVSTALGSDLKGHYKYGCSKSILMDWHLDWEDGYLDGKKYIETMTIRADTVVPTISAMPLSSHHEYELRAYGTAYAGDTIDFDAMYSLTNRIPGDTWTDSVSGYTSHGKELLDLQINGASVDWGAYTPSHVYRYMMPGTDTPLSAAIYDIFPSNNTGELYIDISIDLW